MVKVERQGGGGRPVKYSEKDKDKIVILWNKGLTQQAIADKMGCGKTTVYRILRERR